MKAKIMCIGLLLASCATNAAGIEVFDLGKTMEQSDRAKAMRQEREYREMQMQQQRRQQQREEEQYQQQRAEQERLKFQEQQARQQQQLRQQQPRLTGQACMTDCKKAGYKYNECKGECMTNQELEKAQNDRQECPDAYNKYLEMERKFGQQQKWQGCGGYLLFR